MRLPRVDLHVHTSSSDGAGTVPEVIMKAQNSGLQVVALTDHFDDEGRKCVSELELLQNIHTVRGRRWGIHVVVGVEAGLMTRLSPSVKGAVDFVIRSVHSFPGMKTADRLFDDELWGGYKQWVLRALTMPETDVLGHIEGYLPMPPSLTRGTTFEERREMERLVAARYFDRQWQEEVAQTARECGVAIEIHGGSRTPRIEFIEVCRKYGVKFSVGSDAHLLEHVGNVGWALEVLEELGANEDDIIVFAGSAKDGNTRLTGTV